VAGLGVWFLNSGDECDYASRRGRVEEASCIEMESYDWDEGEVLPTKFLVSTNGLRHWKFTVKTFSDYTECMKYDFTPKHSDDFFDKECSSLKAYEFYRWYFVRDDYVSDTRFETIRVHASEYDCSLGDIPLSNGFTYAYTRGHRDGRLCPFDWQGELRKKAYGNNFMISPNTRFMHYMLWTHASFILTATYTSTILLVRERYFDAPITRDSFGIKIIRYALAGFLLHIPVLIYAFILEPFNDTYVLSNSGGKLDGGPLNASSFMHAPMKILFCILPWDNSTKFTIFKGYLVVAFIGLGILGVVTAYRKYHSKVAYDIIVGAVSCLSAWTFWTDMAVDLMHFKAKQFDELEVLKTAMYKISLGWHLFICMEMGAVANTLPYISPSMPWFVCLPFWYAMYTFFEKYIKP
jgi:hypothetical protein